MSLSLWRIHKTWEMMAFFVAMSTINSTYCSFWDIVMDFSLGDYSAPHPFLRKQLQYADHIWWYYGVIILDPILRFNWVFYVIFANDRQHASIVSFLIALSEVIRRGIWSIFRVENEQIANIRHLKAHREPPVPYNQETGGEQGTDGEETAADTSESPMTRTLKRVGTTLTSAHYEDYVRRKPSTTAADEIVGSDDDEDEDEDD